MADMLLVINFDDANSRAVARKLRAERICCKIVSGATPYDELMAQDPLGFVLAGGIGGAQPFEPDRRILMCGKPILSLGDTAERLCLMLGGRTGEKTVSRAITTVNFAEDPLFTGLDNCERLLTYAVDLTLTPEMTALVTTPGVTVGFAHRAYNMYAIQFQIEQNDPDTTRLLRNFALNICGCTTWWDNEAFVSLSVEGIQKAAGEDGIVLCAMTGGLDSGVSAMLAYRAVGARMRGLFIDTGLLRENEANRFLNFYRDQIGMHITLVPARERFLSALEGVEGNNEKRAIIGRMLQDILDEQAARFGACAAMIKGTSFNDTLKQGTGPRPSLKMDAPVIEPVRELFKDEIRRVGEYLGMPGTVFSTQPFPGSGLALRIMGKVNEQKLSILRAADAIFCAEVEQSGQAKRLWKYFAVLSTVPGEDKEDVAICLRAVHASEGTQAYAARLPYDLLENVTARILQECPAVRRVMYDMTPSSHYQGIEWQ